MKKTLISLLLLALFSCARATTEMPPPSTNDGGAQKETTGAPVSAEGAETAPGWHSVSAGQYATPPSGPLGATGDAYAPPSPRREAGSASRGRSADVGGPAPRDRNWGQAETAAPAVEAPAAALDDTAAPSGSKMRGRASGLSQSGSGGAAMSRRSRSVARPEPKRRPGLGTTWGETRYSPVAEVAFVRDSRGPSYTASLNYNDEPGARGLAGYGYWSSSAAVNLSGALTVSLRDEWGSTLGAYRSRTRTVAIGAVGQRYSIVVQNRTNERFEVVLSVDGLDVLDGRAATYSKRGYLIGPYETIEVDGFRQSDDAVAAFCFGAVSDSYAARTGSARNVGIIGVAAFGEQGYAARLQAYLDRVAAERVSYREVVRRRDADPFPNRYAAPPLNLAH